MRTPLKDFVVSSVDSARVAREWEGIRARRKGTEGRKGRRWEPLSLAGGWRIAGAFALAIVLLAGVRYVRALRAGDEIAVAEGAWLESGAEESAPIALGDGTNVVLEPNSRAQVVGVRAEDVRIGLERGGVRVDARETARRRVVVSVGGYEARARGKRFAVHRLGFAIDVRAQRGDVEVATPGGVVRTVRSGETWQGGGSEAPSASGIATLPGAVPSTTPDLAPSGIQRAPGAKSSPPSETGMLLFDEAQRARDEGRLQDAAGAFDKLRHSFRRDPRAGLAAFELGRLRLDSLGDPRGAEEAFRDAVALAPRSPFREDADARRVQALGRLGDHAACVAASRAYLDRYPTGAYRKAVAVYCGGQ